VARTSPLLGILTLVLDATKGFVAVYLASRGEIVGSFASSAAHVNPHTWSPPADTCIRCVLAALFAILGHMFPVWLKFRGGKGVATGLGSFVLLAPRAVLVMVGIFLLVVAIFRYVSLASILAVALFPLLAWLLHDYRETPFTLSIMAISSILIVSKHHENIRRLLTGTENRLGAKRG
jgi:glycerol-3-phosphate acyltransferase PlsY